MATVFSHPAFPLSDNYSVVGYNLMVSRAKGNTTVSASLSPGAQTITPASMVGIVNGSLITLEPGKATQETVVASGCTSSTFVATLAGSHTGPFTIQSDSLSPNFFGPWTILQSNYTQNLAIVDFAGSERDLYRVQPILQANVGTVDQGPTIAMPYSRAFYASTPMYDAQINSLIQNLRVNFLKDPGTKSTDSTVITESTGQGVMPFITDVSTSRFYLAFLPNDDPIKFRDSECVVYAGSTAATAVALAPYRDYFAHPTGGYIDFATNPSIDSYLRVEYTSYTYSDDECRDMLTNAVSELSLYGLTDQTYAINSSYNYYYLAQSLPSRDVGQIVCAIARKNALSAEIHSAFKGSEAWKTNNVSYTADPSRSIQAGTAWQVALDEQIQQMANTYIVNTRVYFSRGELDSFFDNSGLFYPPFSIYNVFNWMSWWI